MEANCIHLTQGRAAVIVILSWEQALALMGFETIDELVEARAEMHNALTTMLNEERDRDELEHLCGTDHAEVTTQPTNS